MSRYKEKLVEELTKLENFHEQMLRWAPVVFLALGVLVSIWPRIQVRDKPKITTQLDVKCTICYDQNVEIVLAPCGHAILCNRCSPNVKKCPKCRSVI